MRFASLGSGSRGNALVVETGATRVLVDCGFSTRSTVERLNRLGLAPDGISALLITHEHSDHVAGAVRFSGRFDIPLFMTHGTLNALGVAPSVSLCQLIDPQSVFAIGDLEIQPFPVPHDAREPVQYLFSNGTQRLGVLTDCGSVTAHVAEVLNRCDALVLECNHDAKMLSASRYPAMLKRRISGSFGHLDNDQAASLLTRIDCHRLQHIVAAHLSEENNDPSLAQGALAQVLGCAAEWVGVADQASGFDWRQLR